MSETPEKIIEIEPVSIEEETPTAQKEKVEKILNETGEMNPREFSVFLKKTFDILQEEVGKVGGYEAGKLLDANLRKTVLVEKFANMINSDQKRKLEIELAKKIDEEKLKMYSLIESEQTQKEVLAIYIAKGVLEFTLV